MLALNKVIDFMHKVGSNYLICVFVCVGHNHSLQRLTCSGVIHSIASRHWNTSVILKCL